MKSSASEPGLIIHKFKLQAHGFLLELQYIQEISDVITCRAESVT